LDHEEDKGQKLDPLVDIAVKVTAAKAEKGHKTRRTQKGQTELEKILIKPKKGALSSQPSKPANKLNEAFASIDLNHLETESIPSPAPYSAPKAAIIVNEKNGVIKSRRPKKEEKTEKKTDSPVTAPFQGGLAKVIADPDAVKVTALEFYCDTSKPNTVTVKLEVQNKSTVEISSAGLESLVSEVKINIIQNFHTIAPKAQAVGKFGFTVPSQDPINVKLRLIPVCVAADALDTSLLIQPSYFLVPGSVSDVTAAESAPEKLSFALTLEYKPREILQQIVITIRGLILPQGVKTAKLISAKTTTGLHVSAWLSFDGQNATIEVLADEKKLGELIYKELKDAAEAK
jgi:hypothetical protein